jgi:uncharacterized protein (UPF0332 family)
MLTLSRINLSRLRLENADEDLETATENMKAGRYRAANNRAYYSIFHGIRAVLALDGVDFKTHSRLIGYFNKNYIHTELIERSLSEVVFSAVQSRTDSDYDDSYKATKEEAEKNIIGAERLLKAIRQLIDVRLKAETIQDDLMRYDAEPNYIQCEQEDESEVEP